MKTFSILMLAALAAGQQFQQNSNPSVWLATPGFFQQGGSSSQGSSQFGSNSFQSAGRVQNQGAAFRSASGQGSFGQSVTSQNNNQFQSVSARNENRNNQFQSSRSGNENRNAQFQSINSGNKNRNIQFEIGSSRVTNAQQNQNAQFQQNNLRQSSISQPQSGVIQQSSQSFQSNQANTQNQLQGSISQQSSTGQLPANQQRDRFNQQIPNNQVQFSRNQQNSGNHFQTNFNRQVPDNQIQSKTFQQNSNSQFQSSGNQGIPNFGNTVQPAAFQQIQTGSNQQNNRFQQNANQQSSSQLNRGNNFPSTSTSGFQTTFSGNNNRASQGQSQSSNFFRSSSGSSAESFNNFEAGSFEPLNLPSGASFLLGEISTSFSCADRPYGYYADEENSCRVFHVCNPALFENGEVQTIQYSFMCGEGSQFDQDKMTCVEQYEAIPCQESRNYYFRNEDFGLPEEKSL